MTSFPIPPAALDNRLAFVGTSGSGAALTVIRTEADRFEPSRTDCAYAAGFFDGEGNINLARSKRPDCLGPAYVLTVGAAQNLSAPLVFLQNRWGGSICQRPPKPPRKGHFVWSCHANLAAAFLIDVLPHLTVKRDRAELALAFQNIKAGQGRHGNQVERRRQFEGFYQQMRALNGFPPNPLAAGDDR